MFTAQYLTYLAERFQLFQGQIIALAVIGLVGYVGKRFCKKNRLLQRASLWLITLGKGVIVAIPVTLFQEMTRQSWLIIALIGVALIVIGLRKGKQEAMFALQSSIARARKEGIGEGFVNFTIWSISLLTFFVLVGSWIWSASYAVNHQSVVIGALLFMVAKIVFGLIAMSILVVIVMIVIPFLVRRYSSVAAKSVKREPTSEELVAQEHAKARLQALKNVALELGVELGLSRDMQNCGHLVVSKPSKSGEGRDVAYLYPGQLRDLYDDPAPEGVISNGYIHIGEFGEGDGIWSDEDFERHHQALLSAARRFNLKLIANGDQ